MSVNRFRRIAPVLDPTMHMYRKETVLPDLSQIGALASGLQASYDTKIPRPQHIQGDAPLVDQMFVKPVEDLKSRAVEAFKKGDTSQGVNYMKQMEQFIYNSKQPGGAYNAFEDTYSKASAYRKSIIDNKDIAKDTKDFSINKSLSGFTTFDPEGNRNEFSGYTPAKDVDLNDYFTKLTKDWAETEWVKGYSKTLGGQYFDQRTGKKVSKQEIVNSLRDSWMNNPDIRPYVQQLTEMYGEEEALKRVTSSINLAAEKEAFESETSKLVGNKEYDISGQIRVARAKKNMEEEGDTTTGLLAPFKYSPLPSQSVDVKDGKVLTSVGIKPKASGVSYGNYPTLQNTGKYVYDNRGLNQLLTDPKMKSYFDERPGLETIVKSVDPSGMKPSDYNAKVAKMYESMTKSNTVSLGYETLSPAQIKKTNSVLLGDKKEDLGAIKNSRVSLLSTSAIPVKISSEEIADNKDKINFYAKSNGGNGYLPGAVFGTYNRKGVEGQPDGVYNIVVEPISLESQNHYHGLKILSSPTISKKETGFKDVMIPGAGRMQINAVPKLKFDENGNYENTELEFFIKEDDGTINKLPWTKDQVQGIFESNAPGAIKTTSVIK
jgi:hypothetical protein